MDVHDLPRYQANPFHLFFETYVLDVIGALPAGKQLEAADVERVFGKGERGWREAVCAALRLSDTIDVAILDAWLAHADGYREYEPRYRPFAFAQDFVDRYFEPESGVDVWRPGELDLARARIAERRTSA